MMAFVSQSFALSSPSYVKLQHLMTTDLSLLHPPETTAPLWVFLIREPLKDWKTKAPSSDI